MPRLCQPPFGNPLHSPNEQLFDTGEQRWAFRELSHKALPKTPVLPGVDETFAALISHYWNCLLAR